MAGKTYTQTIQFKGTFDGSQILSSLKQIRGEMGKTGADSNLFKNVDKDLADAEKLVQNLTAQIQKGFSNPKEISGFEKELNKLSLVFNKINVGFENINKVGNFNFNASSIADAQKALADMQDQQESLQQAARDSVEAQLQSLKLRQDERNRILDEVRAQGQLEDAVKKVADEKERAAKAKIGKEVLDTDDGKDLLDRLGSRATLTAEDLGLKATNKTKKRGHDDVRQRTSSNGIRRDAEGNQIIDNARANEAILKEYPRILQQVIESGGNAADAIELMKQAMDEYGAEITETDKLQENFARDLEEFEQTGLDSAQQRRLNRARRLGSTDQQGRTNLSDRGRDIVNNADVTAMNDNDAAINAQQDAINAQQAAAAERAIEENERLKATIEQLNQQIARSSDENDKNTEELRETADASEDLASHFDELKQNLKSFLSIGGAISAIKQAITETVTDIKELDKSFASIAMVTDYSVGQMWESYGSYADMANRLGQSTKDVIASSALFYQQGLDTAESLKLTESTMKLATLAGSDFETATSQMTAALRGFHMEMDEGERITDVYSELAAKAAADVNDIAYAMSKTASIASSAGMEFETTSAFLTQMIETTQEAPENIGTAMKTIIARFTELKENVAGTDKSEFDDLSYNKVDTALKSVGVSLKDTTGQFRDIDDVFLELSSKWDTLDRNTQRYIATTAAGSRQQSRFLAMMENYDRTVQLVDTAYDSAGRSSEQFGKYSDTLEYKLNQLTNTWEQMRLKFLDSDFLKNIVDLLNDLVSTISNLDGKELLSIGIIGVTLGKTIITQLIDTMKKGTASVQQAWKDLMNKSIPKKGTGDFSGLSKAFLLQTGNTKKEYLANSAQIWGGKRIDAPNLGTNMEIQKTQELQKQLHIYTQLLAKAKEESNTAEKTTQEFEEQAKAQKEKVNKLAEELGYRDKINEGNAEEIDRDMQGNQLGESALGTIALSGAKNAITGGLTAGITMAIAGADFETIATTIGGTFVTTFVSSIIPSLIESAIGAIGVIAEAIGAIPLAFIGAALAAAAIGVWFWNEQQEAEEAAHQAELNRLKDIQKTNEELHKKQIENLKESANTEKKIESLDEALETYETLSNKSVRTQEEEEELTTAINTLNEDFSDIVLAYDENTQKLTMSTEATDNLREELELQRDSAQQEAMLNMVQSVEGTKGAAETASQLADEYSVAALNDYTPVALDFTKEVVNGLGYFTGHEDILANVYDELKISEKDLKNEKDFLVALESSGKTVNDFRNVMSDALKSLSGALDEDALKEARIGAENYYSTLKLDGEQISGDLAKSLSYMIQDIDIDNISKDQVSDVTSQGIETNKNFLRNYLQEYQKTGTVSNDGGVEKALQGLKVGDKTADEIIKAKIDEFKQNEETLMDGFDGNLAEWSKLPEDFRQWLDDEGYEETSFDDDIRKDASKSKELLDRYFYELFLAESNSFNLLTQEELDAQSDNLGEVNQLLTNASQYTKEQFLQLLTEMVRNLPKEIRDGILAGQGLKWSGTKTNGSIIEDVNNAVEGSIIDKYNDTVAAVKAYGVTGAEEASQTLNQAILDYIEQFKLNELQAADFAQGMLDTSASEEAINSFYSLDFGNMSTLDLSKAKDEYKKLREEAGISISEIEQEWNELVDLSKESGVLEFKITGVDDIENMHSKMLDFTHELTEGFGKLSTAISNQAEKGFILYEDYYDAYKALEELNLEPEKFLTSNGDGTFGLASEEAASAVADQLNNTEAITEEIEAAIDARIEELEMQIAILRGEYSEIDALSDENLIYADQLAIINQIGAAKAKINNSDWRNFDIPTFAKSAKTLTQQQRDKNIEIYQKEIEKLNKAKEDKTYLKNLENLTDASIKQVYDTLNTSIDKGVKAKNEDASASKDAADAADKLAEAQKKLNEAMYGTELYKGASDALSNYTTKLEELTEAADKAREKLEALTSEDSASQLMDDYIQNVHQETVTLEAENRVIEQSMANIKKILDENYGQYFKENNGKLYWDASLNDAQMNDQFKDYVYQQIEEYNKFSDNIKENNEKIEKREKEYRDMRKNAIDARVALEEKVVQVLEEKYQEEIDATQKKYTALKEADDDYVTALEEAIKKQRELREQDQKYQDLATKEKRLSLLERDTSGANRKNIASQREELENSRQEMMDNEVDRIINEMKELYKTQQEVREEEIEYMEAMKENAILVQEANEILANHQTYDELLQWFYENNSALTEKSVAQLEQFNMELEDEFNKAQLYFETSAEDITDLTQATEEEIVMTMKDISETLTTEADRSFQEVTEKVKDEIEEAQKGVQSALEAVTDAANALAQAANQYDGGGGGTDDSDSNTLLTSKQENIAQQYGLTTVQAVEAWNKAHPDKKIDTNTAIGATTQKKDMKTNNTKNKTTSQRMGLANNSKAQDEYNKTQASKVLENIKQRAINAATFDNNMTRIGTSSGVFVRDDDDSLKHKNNFKYRVKIGKKSYIYFNNDEYATKYGYYWGQRFEKIYQSQVGGGGGGNHRFATGGLVDYTGPAWVDGTPNKPEAFLNSEDTKRIGEAAKILSNLQIFNSTSSAQDAVSTNIGDTSIEIHINVENLASDYDVDKMIERVKQDIVDVSQPVGTPVILRR